MFTVKNVHAIIAVSVIFLIFATQNVSAIRCFECNSHNDTRCAQNIPPDNLSVECGDHKHGVAYTLCRKITQVIEFSVNNLPPDSRVIRGCGYETSSHKNACYQRAGFGGRQEVCACITDNCNSAGYLQNVFYVTAVGAISTIVFYLKF